MTLNLNNSIDLVAEKVVLIIIDLILVLRDLILR